MPLRWFRFGSLCGGRLPVNVQHESAVERRLSIGRLVLALPSLAALLLWNPLEHSLAGVVVLLGYAIHSTALAVRAYRRSATRRPHTLALHVSDVIWVAAVVESTGGAGSPFFAFFIFALLGAGYRWGLVETVATGAVAALVTAGDILVRVVTGWSPAMDLHLTAARLLYLIIGGFLIGYLAEDERRHRARAWAVSRIMGLVRSNAGLVSSVHAVLDELMKELCAARTVLTLREEGSEQVLVWQAEAATERSMRLHQEPQGNFPAYLFELPTEMDAWVAVRGNAGTVGDGPLRLMALDAEGVRVRKTASVAPLLATPFDWQEAMCLSSVAGDGWSGRLFLFDSKAPGFAEEHLRFLQVVVRQVGPALFNLYLQRRLHSRTGIVERARISRELHDGVIQSLIGVEMQLEVARREAGTEMPEGLASQLAGVQGALRHEILNVRDLMHMLKPVEVDAGRLVEHLADAVERFRYRTAIDAQLSCATDELDLSPRVCREVAGVVQEALANVRKHSGATQVLVRLAPCPDAWQLAIDDNGHGFDFEGTLDHESLDAQRRGPLIIKERVRSIGGRLTIHSQPGFGARLEVTIPRKHHG
jgi:signal transduction histidine kinase